MEKIDEILGGFIISKNVLSGKNIKYTYRERSSIPQLNGWTIYSIDDDNQYVSDSTNFEIVGATTMFKISPVMAELFNAPYGTDLCWLYKEDVLIGFYDLVSQCEKTIDEIVSKNTDS